MIRQRQQRWSGRGSGRLGGVRVGASGIRGDAVRVHVRGLDADGAASHLHHDIQRVQLVRVPAPVPVPREDSAKRGLSPRPHPTHGQVPCVSTMGVTPGLWCVTSHVSHPCVGRGSKEEGERTQAHFDSSKPRSKSPGQRTAQTNKGVKKQSKPVKEGLKVTAGQGGRRRGGRCGGKRRRVEVEGPG